MNVEPRQAKIEVSVLDGWTADSGVDMVIEQAWLPMVVLDGVKVTIQAHEGIGVMERFVLEALLRLQTLVVGDLQEIASIPIELGAWLLASLGQKGLVRNAGVEFTPEVERCVAALESGQLPVERTVQRGLLWFPESDEVVLLGQADGLLRDLRTLRSSGRWPVPAGWHGKTREALLREPLKSKRFYGDGTDTIVSIQDDTVVKDEHFPAYRCSATASLAGGNDSWYLNLHGTPRRKRDDAPSEPITISLPVPPLSQLLLDWRQRIFNQQSAIADQVKRLEGISVQWNRASGFSSLFQEGEARTFAGSRLVSAVHGLKLRVNDEFQCIVPLRCNPADDGAARVFAVDRAIRSFLSGDRTDRKYEEASRQDMHNRLWDLRLFKPLYDLREATDFAA